TNPSSRRRNNARRTIWAKRPPGLTRTALGAADDGSSIGIKGSRSTAIGREARRFLRALSRTMAVARRTIEATSFY
ncbi:MAG: hypothetical protein WBX25_06160, partial [Rhodomicrobium sp.]